MLVYRAERSTEHVYWAENIQENSATWRNFRVVDLSTFRRTGGARFQFTKKGV